MKRIVWLMILSAVLLAGGCADDPDPSGNYLIFGQTGGSCPDPECTEYFKIMDGELYENTSDEPTNDGTFKFEPYQGTVPADVFQLPGQIPAGIYDESATIGWHTLADEGNLYLELQLGNDHHAWSISKFMDSVPQYLHPYCALLAVYLDQL